MIDKVVCRKGMKYIPFMEPDLDPDRIVVSMIEFQSEIYVATQKGIYKMVDEELVRLKFVPQEKLN